jgi:hypothetical protein
MEQVTRVVRNMISSGRRLSEVVEYLRNENDFVLTAFNFLRVVHEALGASLTEVRPLLEPFDASMNPIVPISEMDHIGDEVFARYRESTQ